MHLPLCATLHRGCKKCVHFKPLKTQALLAYIRSGLDESAYWDTLHAGGVTAARLASFDRPITHAPSFSPGVCIRWGCVH